MFWHDLTRSCKTYLISIYILAAPFAVLCFGTENTFSTEWLSLTLVSLFVSTVNVRLAKISSVISMGDVFTILVLMHFGPGAALITYWLDIVAANFADVVRRYGLSGIARIKPDKFVFNVACCALSVWVMNSTYRFALNSTVPYPGNVVLGLLGIALSWFFVNTVTLSIAISLWSAQTLWTVWREGVVLAFLNFSGSAAAAGLISLFYRGAGFWVFLLSLPIAVVLYQLYLFYIERYEQAQAHISQLNKLYLQTIEALASAVDAKDRYTHGHIRRVQAYAAELARWAGIRDDKELSAIQAGALLHDIGKIAIPEYILNKPTVLTATEFEKMKIHPVVGANMLQSIDFPYPVVPIVKYHHERWDGNGYPEALKGEDIPLSARILALVDCYDALTTNRPYRSPMQRSQIMDFFRHEAGRAYDPKIVEVFIEHLDEIESAGNEAAMPDTDIWGIKDAQYPETNSIRQLERVQPIVTYSKALNAGAEVQREIYSVFEFARAEIQCLNRNDVLTFMGSKLANLIRFDAAVFYIADLDKGTVTGEHVLGASAMGLKALTLSLEQKLSGWVAANRQALCNLPPFPDFLTCSEPRPTFQLSAIAPINRGGTVYGAISLYRKEKLKFSEEEFRRLEIIASQTAIALSKCSTMADGDPILFDALTHVPNGYQLYLMFDQIAMDAHRYEYRVALLSIHLDDLKTIRRRWGHMSGDEALRAIAKHLGTELRETDLLVRYASDEFVALNIKMNRDQAEALKSRLQNALDHFRFPVRPDAEIPLPASIGISVYPDDGTDLETLLADAEWRMREDHELRSAVKRRVRHFPNPD